MESSSLSYEIGRAESPVRTALELWEVFTTRGGLVPNTHDQTLFEELRSRLRVPTGMEIPDHLKAENVSTTDFLIALLGATGPWAQMISGIYSMFDRHGIAQSNDSVVLEFDFSRGDSELKFTPNHFKRALAAYDELTRVVESRKFVAQDLFDFLKVVPRLLAEANGLQTPSEYGSVEIGRRADKMVFSEDAPASPAFRAWREIGLSSDTTRAGGWPFASSAPLPTYDDELARAIAPLNIAAMLINSIAERYAGWEQLIDATRGEKSESRVGEDVRGFIGEWKLSKALYAQHDRLGPNLVKLAWHVYELAPTDPVARAKLAKDIRDAIAVRSEIAQGQVSDRALDELLDLPLWRQRHQLYSIWILTVIERAKPKGAVFNLLHEQGKLSFSFNATTVARLIVKGTTLEWITELRTTARDFALSGEGRKEAVQPDYILRYVGDAESVLYVLEAKQYRRGDTRNFSQALYDYAGVHQEARIALANYGSMPRTIKTAVEALVMEIQQANPTDLRIASRCRTFGKVKPGEEAAIEALRLDILEVLEVLPSSQYPRLFVDVTGSMKAVLPEPGAEWSAVWNKFRHWNAPITLVADRVVEELPSTEAMKVPEHIRRHAVQSGLSLGAIPRSESEGGILLTDKAGFDECSGEILDFSAVVVLASAFEGTVFFGSGVDMPLLLDLAMSRGVKVERLPGKRKEVAPQI